MIPLFYICMGHMANIPIPPIFAGHKNMMIYALTQLLLTVPIIAINFHYFIKYDLFQKKSLKNGIYCI